jgi:hypothetical protein
MGGRSAGPAPLVPSRSLSPRRALDGESYDAAEGAHGDRRGQRHIDRPPDEVSRSSAGASPRWRKNVVRVEWLDDGPMRVGQRRLPDPAGDRPKWTVEAEIVEGTRHGA